MQHRRLILAAELSRDALLLPPAQLFEVGQRRLLVAGSRGRCATRHDFVQVNIVRLAADPLSICDLACTHCYRTVSLVMTEPRNNLNDVLSKFQQPEAPASQPKTLAATPKVGQSIFTALKHSLSPSPLMQFKPCVNMAHSPPLPLDVQGMYYCA